VNGVALASTGIVDDPDTPALVAALGALGVAARPVAWADEDVDWDGFDATVIRSTWDYPMAHQAFLAWTRRVPNLVNPADVVEWNSDKRYLDDLARAGVPTIPTTYAKSGDAASLPDGPVVVKPTVSGGSRGAASFSADDQASARAHVDAIAALGVEAMVQPLVASVESEGETDVIVIDGAISHAVVKHAPLGTTATAEPSGPLAVTTTEPNDAVRTIVADALAAIPFAGPLCYARVDVVALATGPAVIEVECIEPFLFFGERPGAAGRMAAAIARRLPGR
jgi:glutathione synthase/RimK-type ligase-like ATP-grasp enzyme